MLDLIKFELYKIFSKKSVRVILILTVLFSLFNVFGESIYLKSKGIDNIDDAYNIMKNHEGKLLTQEVVEKINGTIEALDKKEKDGNKLTKEEVIYKYYLYEAMISDPTYIVNNKYYSIDEMKSEIMKLEKENKTDEYEYKNLTFVYEKVKNIEQPKYYFKYGWSTTTDFDTIAVLMSILIAVGLASMFSGEYESNSAQIILSCRRGKDKLVLSKIIAGLTFTVIVFTIINSIFLLSALRYDFIGWDKPLELFKYYRATPFDMRVIDFYIVGLGISFMGAILFALATMLISLLVKNNMISLLLSLGMYYLPTFIAPIIPIDKVAKYLNEINISEAMRVELMFVDTNTFNVFGNPMLYSTVLISLVLLFTPVAVYLIKYFGKKQVI